MELKEVGRSPSRDLVGESSGRLPHSAPGSPDVGQAVEAAALWRVRVTVDDKPGVLEKFAGRLGPLGAEILSLHADTHSCDLEKELVVAVPEHLRWSDLVAAAIASGTTVSPTGGVSDSRRKRSFVIEGVSL
jgi:hypothetical protein